MSKNGNKLSESEIRLQAIMESANDAIISADNKGIIISWNKAAKTIFGYEKEEVLGKPLTLIIPEQYRKAHEKGIECVNSTGKTRIIGTTVELSGLKKDGSIFPVELSLAVCQTKTGNFYNGIIRDITKRKKVEEALRRNEEILEKKAQELQRVNQDIKERKEQLEVLAGKLAKYLSPQVYSLIFSGKKDVKVETHRKKLTIFFSDIKDFTELTDSMEGEALSSLLNDYLDEMSKIALRYGGTIDKFIGDTIMIFFGDPETKGEQDDALTCILMALEMRARMKHLRRKWDNQGILKSLRIRMGINTGFCTVGNFGSEDRLDYTIIGGQVNLANRLESSAKADQILISHETYALVKDKIFCEKKNELKMKGIAYPVQTYQVIDYQETLTKEKKELKEEFDGFSLSVDVNRADKEQVIKTLRKTIKKLN